MLRNLFKLIVAFFCGSSANAATNGDSLNILFIGNSYTHMNSMPMIFDKICKAKGKPVHVEMNTRAGASFSVHTTRADMWEKIASRKWDYVIMQGYSREFIQDPQYLDTASVPYMNQIIDSIKTHNPCTNILFYMTWGYKEGYQENELTNTHEKMVDRIAFGYKYVGEIFDVAVVPVGQVWKELRKKHPSINLYDKDLAHPNRNGSYLIACTFYSAIFRESSVGAITKTIDAQNAKTIQKHASEFVLKNLPVYKLDRNVHDIIPERTSEAKYFVHCSANYPGATSITWDFGDGTTSTDKKVSHQYKKPGTYIVKLKVVDTCGERNYSVKVVHTAPAKPKSKQKSKPKTKPQTKKKI